MFKIYANCTDGSAVEYGTAEFRKKLANGEVTSEEAARCLEAKYEWHEKSLEEAEKRYDELGWEEHFEKRYDRVEWEY